MNYEQESRVESNDNLHCQIMERPTSITTVRMYFATTCLKLCVNLSYFFHINPYYQYHANEYYAATGEDIPADDNAIRLNQRRLFELGGAGIQQYHANEYNAATGANIPASNEATGTRNEE